MKNTCNRCKRIIHFDAYETCWFCQAKLCAQCWDIFGHCGHVEADKQNDRARMVPQPPPATPVKPPTYSERDLFQYTKELYECGQLSGYSFDKLRTMIDYCICKKRLKDAIDNVSTREW